MSMTPERPVEPEEQGISLQELSEAFARVLGGQPEFTLSEQQVPSSQERPSEPAAEPATAVQLEGAESVPLPNPAGETPAGHESDDDACQLSPRTILEAMLFVGNRQNDPLSAHKAAELMRGVEADEVPGLVDELNRRYQAHGCPFEVCADHGGYQMTLREEFFPIRSRLYGRVREARLSQAAIDVLAIVAYRQPLTGDEVGRARGKPSGHVLAQLVRRQLLRIERTEERPRKTLYYTTARFLALFGLESLGDLPQSEELDRR